MNAPAKFRLRGRLTCLCGANEFERPSPAIARCIACGFENWYPVKGWFETDFEPLAPQDGGVADLEEGR